MLKKGWPIFKPNMAGKELVIEFELAGQRFAAINAGSEFHFNPSISFMLNFDPSQDNNARENLDDLWENLLMAVKR